MHKDFDSWNEKKKKLDTLDKHILFKEGDIWWCYVGLNVGDESCGKGETFRRPVLVIKKLSRRLFIGLPLSTQRKHGNWFDSLVVGNKRQYILLYQVRVLSSNRLRSRIVTIEDFDLIKIKQKLEALLELR